MHHFKFKHTSKKPGSWKISKDPSTDWFLILSLSFLLLVGVISVTSFRYYKVNKFITSLSMATGASADASLKTKEEEMQEIIKFYQDKQKRHDQLLGRSKIDVKKEQEKAAEEARQAEIASSTAAAKAAATSTKPVTVPGSSTPVN